MRRIRIERRSAAHWLVGLGLACAAAFASPDASAGPAEGRAQARAHFDQGVVLARRHAYADALTEFERAYEISPHFSVLYNIGKALIALGRPTEAIAALDRYVEEGGSDIEPRRRAEADAAIESELLKTGSIEVTVDVSGALVSIDDKSYGRSPLPVPVRVDSGAHRVLAVRDSGEQREANVDADAGQVTHARLEFGAEAPSTPVATPARGQLRIRCAERGLSVLVDDQPSGVTPLSGPLLLEAGNHRLRFARGAEKSVEQRLSVPAQSELECSVPPRLTPARSGNEPQRAAAHRPLQKTLAYVVEAAGVALTGAAAVHFLWNRARYQDWQSRYDTYYRDPSPQNRESANGLARSIESASAVTIGLAIGAAVALGTGAVLQLTSTDSVAAAGTARDRGPLVTLRGAF
jgi:hypothetical protein